jgi:hypothetical protein
MTEPIALALAIAGLYGEALRAQERGDSASAAQCLEAFDQLGTLNEEHGATQITVGLCATMLRAHKERTA